MRLTFILLTAAFLQVSAKGLGQSVTITLRDAPMEQVFREIEKQTGYGFLYTKKMLQGLPRVSIDMKNASVEQVLTRCLEGKPLDYTIENRTIIISAKPKISNSVNSPPPIDVKGRVVNENGEPVLATVMVKGRKTGTSTNENGEFELRGIEEDAVLVISGVGIETFEVKVEGRNELVLQAKIKTETEANVTVEANTGYERVKPNEVTGSIALVTNRDLNQQAGINILKRLEGITTNVLFDTKPLTANKKSNITVRGLSTINGPLDPLVVLDGFIYEGDINNINPNIIENITILKDAAAASIWGARAGNGVIVITTKKGNFNQQLKLNINTNVIVNSKPDLYYLPQMSSADYIDVEQFLYNKGYYNSEITNTNRPALSPAVEIFLKRSLGAISSADSASQINALKQNDIREEYDKYFYANGITKQYGINLSGGGNNTAYHFAAGYDHSVNELDALYRRLNIKVENTFRPIKNLQATISVYYTNSEAKSGKPGYNSVGVNSRPLPYLKFADENGNPLPVALILRDTYTDTAGAGQLLNWKYYPLEDYKHRVMNTKINELFANTALQYRIFKFLTVEMKYQYQRQLNELIQVQDLESYAARSTINLFSQLNRSTGIVKYIVPPGGIQNTNNSNTESQTFRTQLNFRHGWGNHDISAIIGGETREAHGWGNRFTIYGYNNDPMSNGIVDFKNPYPNFINGSNQFIPGSPAYSADIINRFVSAYTNIAYILKQNYSFSFSARRDGSNIFGVHTNDKWRPLWSAGVGLNISNEKFYRFDLVSRLKLRATYGYSGNVDLRKSALPVATFFSSTNVYTNFPYGNINTMNDPSLRWEKVNTSNIGLDFMIKGNILSGSVDYYIKKGSDLYGSTPYDYTAWGYTQTITRNVANMEGKGLEVQLNSKNIDKGFTWQTTALFTYSDNKVTKYFDPSSQLITTLLGAGNQITPVIDKPLYSIAAYKWGGLDASGNPQGFVNGQKTIDYAAIANEANLKGADGNIIYVGSALPTVFGNLINAFTWRNIEIAANISYKMGYYFRRSSLNYTQLVNGYGHPEYAQRWQNPGDEDKTNVPSFIYPDNGPRSNFYSFSEINVLKGDHVRLQYVNLNYSLGDVFGKRNLFKELRLYVNASNLGIIWRANKEDLDPEYPSSIPPLKSFAFGVKARL